MARLSLELLGGFRARIDHGPELRLRTRRAHALVAYLALAPGRLHSRDALTNLLWGDSPEPVARKRFRQSLHVLRRALSGIDPSPLEQAGESIRLDPAGVELDVARFERLAGDGDLAALRQAAALQRGELLQGIGTQAPEFEEWLIEERERLREMMLEVLGKVLRQELAGGRREAAILTAVRFLALDPLEEVVHRMLMHLYAEAGRRGAALRQYQVCVDLLERELGVEPEAETRNLYQQLLQQVSARPAALAPPALDPQSLPRARPVKTAARPARPPRPVRDIPLLGRDAQLRQTRELLDAVWAGTGQVCLVLGEAGAGKTRLVEALAAEAGARGGRVLASRSYETGQILPLRPWADALRDGRVVPEIASLDCLGAAWRDELARLFPELERTGPETLPAPENQVRLFEAAGELLGQLSARHPLILVLEDLHWADDLSLRLFSFVACRLPSRAVLVVGSAREEEVPGTPLLGRLLEELNRQPHVTRLAVPALARAETDRLVGALARADIDPDRVARLGERVWALSRGNPFVIVESMRALQEGAEAQAGGALPLPPRVREIIAGRLRRVGERSRHVADVAAVIGRRFDFALLAAAARLGESEMAEALEELVRRRVLHEVNGAFEFTHDRIQEVAYQGVPADRRRALHAAVGLALEAQHGGHLEGSHDGLAYHFARTDQAAKAVEYLARFAEQATDRYANEQAVGALTEAILHAARLPAEARDQVVVGLVVREWYCLFLLSRLPEMLELLLRHWPRVERLSDPAAAGAYYACLGFTYTGLNDHEAATRCAERAIEQADQCADSLLKGQAYFVLTWVAYMVGRPAEAIDRGLQALALLEPRTVRSDLRMWLAAAHGTVGASYALMGEVDSAFAALAGCEAIADAHRIYRMQNFTAFQKGHLYAKLGKWSEAFACCQANLERMAGTVDAPMASGFLASVHLEKGEADRAIALLEAALDGMAEAPFFELPGLFTARLAHAHLLSGRIQPARELAARAVQLTTEARCAYALGEAQRVAGRVAQADGDLLGAQRHLDEALATFVSTQARLEVARTRLDLAELALACGDRAAGSAELEAARPFLERLAAPRYLDRLARLAADTQPAPRSPLRPGAAT
ncbi:MAG: AAA family ATPase [Candidatus Rokubacteria bacterium]|nr:AAA family ATPase [Candidatus Rokubacteria bacterium]